MVKDSAVNRDPHRPEQLVLTHRQRQKNWAAASAPDHCDIVLGPTNPNEPDFCDQDLLSPPALQRETGRRTVRGCVADRNRSAASVN
jgi:hypothetical protein